MINVLKYRYISTLFSLSLFVAFVGYGAYRWKTQGHVFTYSVDFTGGTQLLLKFSEPVSPLALKDVLDKKGFEGVSTREFSDTEILVRLKEFSNDVQGLAEKIRSITEQEMPGYKISVEESEAVGPGIGKALRMRSVYAVLFALIALLIYISLRFWSFGFAFGAVVALAHDALAMLAIFLFFNREISINVIGAILAVLGYSINDTIVIFSRIRENIKELKGQSITDIVNISIGQTMRRTLLTSLTTSLTVGSMFIFGGEALRDFSLALLVGIVFGTYSSIYIASPVMMLFYKNK
jgi:preprotein translocase subunit SecF